MTGSPARRHRQTHLVFRYTAVLTGLLALVPAAVSWWSGRRAAACVARHFRTAYLATLSHGVDGRSRVKLYRVEVD